MKKYSPRLIIVLAALLSAMQVFSATDIAVTNVSGHWTLSGSPYRIFNDITLAKGQSLLIDPGVEVVFQGYYRLNIYGSFNSTGTPASMIKFCVQDTTGWYDTYTNDGGWSGISIKSQSAVFENCIITELKSKRGLLSSHNLIEADSSKLSFRNVNISHVNLHGLGDSLCYNSLCGFGFSTIEMNGCKVYDNHLDRTMMYFFSCTATVIKCDIYNNIAASGGDGALLYTMFSNLKVSECNVYGNTCGQTCISTTSDAENVVLIRKNNIYKNITNHAAPVSCDGGKVTIESNRICNNINNYTSCMFTGAGSAIFLSTYNSHSDGTEAYLVRNNMIANNYSNAVGGAIFVYASNVSIVNNNIVNNKSSSFGPAIYTTSKPFPASLEKSVFIKNNIISGNISENALCKGEVYIYTFTKCAVEFDHNWMQNSVSESLVLSDPDSFTYASDVTTNLIGSNPDFVAPTLTTETNESALLADFQLNAMSPCIDNGVSFSATGIYDFLYNYRTWGAAIDIGAYEFGAPVNPVSVAPITVASQQNKINIYPNPAHGTLNVVSAFNGGEISIFDVSGKSIFRSALSGSHLAIDISNLSRGTYYILWVNYGEKEVQKFIVE